MGVATSAPEDRMYFVRILGRIEFEVGEEEYQRLLAQVFKMEKAEGPSSMSFNTGCIDGWYIDPRKEEVIDSGGRT